MVRIFLFYSLIDIVMGILKKEAIKIIKENYTYYKNIHDISIH